ncbi:MAG: hypothetical protein MI922_16450 [Bacteroidales bacterium]|nr:hypothetical protein [Bacteroidales bacterium]
MKKTSSPKQTNLTLNPTSLAFAAASIASAALLLTTTLAIIDPRLGTAAQIFNAIYGPFGYNLTIIGTLLGTLYIAIDTFIITFAFAWIYNKLL